MNTSTPTDAALPTLTPIESDAAIAWIEPGGASLLQLAARLKLSPHELHDILARPHVAAFASAIRDLVQVRADILARYNHTGALHELAEIARNRDNDVDTRLRAAIAILRGPRPAPDASVGADRRQLPHTRPTSPAPHPPRLPAVQTASAPTVVGVVGAPKSDHPTDNASDPPTAARRPAPSTPASPVTLHRAAGAPRARHDHGASERVALHAASPTTAGHPP